MPYLMLSAECRLGALIAVVHFGRMRWCKMKLSNASMSRLDRRQQAVNRSRSGVMVCILMLCIPVSTQAAEPKDRFASTEQSEAQPLTHSRSDAVDAAAQVPGAAGVLLEALHWRGRTAKEIGLPSQLWCADFMNFVLKRAGGKGTQSRAARSFLDYGKKLDGPRVGAIVIFSRGGRNNGHVGVVRGTDGEAIRSLSLGISATLLNKQRIQKRGSLRTSCRRITSSRIWRRLRVRQHASNRN